ncbi:MAG: hypothetical protein WCO63_01280 [Bacteroidota bacterium]
MFEKLFKSTKAMGWITLLTLVVVLFFVIDNYRSKNAFGLIKPATAPAA